MYATRIYVAAAAAALTMAELTACGSGDASSAGNGKAGTTPAASAQATHSGAASGADVAGINPCTLLSDADVATLSPKLGHSKVTEVAGVAKVCDWPDSHGLPAVQLQVTLPPASSLRDELKTGLGAGGGYTIVAVSGLGDEAAAAFQKADPAKGLTAGLAAILARSGGKVVQFSTPTLSIQQNSADFTKAKALVAKAISRL